MRRRATRSLLSLLSFLAGCASEPTAPTTAPVAQPAAVAQAAPVAEPAPDVHPIPVGQTAAADGARPELNSDFREPDLDVASWVERFEGESREVAAHREAIANVLRLQPGEAVADIGAGTGLFEELFARAVGPGGTVYAVDISPAFLEHLRQRAAAAGWTQVKVVACDDRSTGLPPASVDAAFLCDTYHHLEHPAETMASLFRALRPGGRLVVVDFEREPGQSRDWVLEHVRCGKAQVQAEIEAAGFRFVPGWTVKGLRENYVLRFVVPDADEGTREGRLQAIRDSLLRCRSFVQDLPQRVAASPASESEAHRLLGLWGIELDRAIESAQPSLEAKAWTPDDVAIASALADYLAILPEAPRFRFTPDADAANAAEARRLKDWLGSRLADPHFRVWLQITHDGGPYFPELVEDSPRLESTRSTVVGDVLVHAGDTSRDDGSAVPFLQGTFNGLVLWTALLEKSRPDAAFTGFERDTWGWMLTFEAGGGRIWVHLSAQGRPEYYFVDW